MSVFNNDSSPWRGAGRNNKNSDIEALLARAGTDIISWHLFQRKGFAFSASFPFAAGWYCSPYGCACKPGDCCLSSWQKAWLLSQASMPNRLYGKSSASSQNARTYVRRHTFIYISHYVHAFLISCGWCGGAFQTVPTSVTLIDDNLPIWCPIRWLAVRPQRFGAHCWCISPSFYFNHNMLGMPPTLITHFSSLGMQGEWSVHVHLPTVRGCLCGGCLALHLFIVYIKDTVSFALFLPKLCLTIFDL